MVYIYIYIYIHTHICLFLYVSFLLDWYFLQFTVKEKDSTVHLRPSPPSFRLLPSFPFFLPSPTPFFYLSPSFFPFFTPLPVHPGREGLCGIHAEIIGDIGRYTCDMYIYIYIYTYIYICVCVCVIHM